MDFENELRSHQELERRLRQRAREDRWARMKVQVVDMASVREEDKPDESVSMALMRVAVDTSYQTVYKLEEEDGQIEILDVMTDRASDGSEGHVSGEDGWILV
jgi:hypothetical protein